MQFTCFYLITKKNDLGIHVYDENVFEVPCKMVIGEPNMYIFDLRTICRFFLNVLYW